MPRFAFPKTDRNQKATSPNAATNTNTIKYWNNFPGVQNIDGDKKRLYPPYLCNFKKFPPWKMFPTTVYQNRRPLVHYPVIKPKFRPSFSRINSPFHKFHHQRINSPIVILDSDEDDDEIDRNFINNKSFSFDGQQTFENEFFTIFKSNSSPVKVEEVAEIEERILEEIKDLNLNFIEQDTKDNCPECTSSSLLDVNNEKRLEDQTKTFVFREE